MVIVWRWRGFLRAPIEQIALFLVGVLDDSARIWSMVRFADVPSGRASRGLEPLAAAQIDASP